MIRPTPIRLACFLGLLAACAPSGPEEAGPAASSDAAVTAGGTDAVVLRPDRIVDGRGETWTGRDVVVRDGRIAAVVETGSTPGTRVYDLAGATLLPGLIDTHVHLGWHFDRETGRIHSGESTHGPEEQALYAAGNAWSMLRSGVTTVQSLGGAEDIAVRDAIAAGTIPGPRVLTSIRPITSGTGSPAEIRAEVDALADAGADVIKIFASASIRDGGSPTLAQAQLDAACGRAAERGLRAVVHAHGPESARRAAEAGCSQIEHGALLDRETLALLAERGLYYDPHIHLVFQNYFDNRGRFLGVGNYTEEGFRQMEAAVPTALGAFREALAVPGLMVVFGTDAVAGAHGDNWRELAHRVLEGGQEPMRALVSATGLAARSLGLEDEIGAVEEGLVADLIAVRGDPVAEIEALADVTFVMAGGTVVRHEPVGR